MMKDEQTDVGCDGSGVKPIARVAPPFCLSGGLSLATLSGISWAGSTVQKWASVSQPVAAGKQTPTTRFTV